MSFSQRLLFLCDRFDQFFIKLGYYVSYIFLFIVAIGFYEVIVRYIFSSPTIWVHEVTTFLVSLSLLYGGVACYANKKRIAMTFLRLQFSARVRWGLVLIVLIFVYILFVLLCFV